MKKNFISLFVTLAALLSFTACEDSTSSPVDHESASAVDTLYISNTDTVYSIQKDTVLSIEKDTVYSIQKDTVFSIGKDTVCSIQKDTILSIEKDTVYSIQKDTVLSIERDTVYSVQKDTVFSIEKDTVYSFQKDTVYQVIRQNFYSKDTIVIKDTSYQIITQITSRLDTVYGVPYNCKAAEGTNSCYDATTNTLVDFRDNKVYKTVLINGQTWMAENINYRKNISTRCMENKTENCATYGSLYTWSDAKIVCPDGWHLPTKEEFEILTDYAESRAQYAGTALKSATGWRCYGSCTQGKDDFGFNALPSVHPYDVAIFWTASEGSNQAKAHYLDISAFGAPILYFEGEKTNYYSVRCLKD